MKKLNNFIRRVFMNGVKLNSNYGLEWNFFYNFRSFSDGITWIDFKLNWDRYESDHKPSFEFYFGLLNFTIIEMSVYYLHHRDEVEEEVIIDESVSGFTFTNVVLKTEDVQKARPTPIVELSEIKKIKTGKLVVKRSKTKPKTKKPAVKKPKAKPKTVKPAVKKPKTKKKNEIVKKRK